MKIDESQKIQYIVLCCLIAAFLVVGVVKMVGKSTQARSPAQKKVQAASETSAKIPEKIVSVEQTDPLNTSDISAQAPRDPFEPQVVPQSVSVQNVQPQITKAQNIPFRIDSLPGQATDGSPLPGLAESNPSGQLRLTGIIEGAVNVAIIRGGENTRYIVREGQTIDGMYRVISISRVGVRLKSNDNQRTIVLQLGGNNAKDETRA